VENENMIIIPKKIYDPNNDTLTPSFISTKEKSNPFNLDGAGMKEDLIGKKKEKKLSCCCFEFLNKIFRKK